MKSAVTIALLTGLAACQAQLATPAPIRSFSGQFQVRGVSSSPASFHADAWAAGTNLISLEPTLLVVSCERIRQDLGRILGGTGQWRGRVDVNLFSARSDRDEVSLVAERLPSGWNYRVALPDVIGRERFLGVVVRVLLLELANRGAGERSAEVPAWLVEGLSQRLLATSGLELLLPPPRWSVRGVVLSPQSSFSRGLQPLDSARQILRTQAPPSFEELSWPDGGRGISSDSVVFRAGAQLLVDRLLGFKDGAVCLRATLEGLPRFFNWQTAFLEGFHPHFSRQIDVEKWWALQLANFTGRDTAQTWSMVESRRKLDEILLAAVRIRRRGDLIPERSQASLQRVLGETDVLQQTVVLQRKLQELDALRLRVAQPLVPLVDDYRRVLQAYYQRRQRSSLINPLGKQGAGIPDRSVDEVLLRLNELDVRREALRSMMPEAPAAQGAALR